MLVSRNALAKLVDLADLSTDALSDLYNNYGGLEVEDIYPVVPPNKYIIGKVLDVQPHPDADKLNVCQVDIGKEKLEIVCGAPNVAPDQYVIVAPVGTVMPNGMKIEAREVRGVASVGMICSLQEIGIDEKYISARDQAGIYVFDPQHVTVGADVLTTLELNTDILDLGLTPNRADCLNYRGLAYETAALTNKVVDPKTFHYEMPEGLFATTDYVTTLEVTSPNVQSYNVIAFKNIKIKPAPQWMQSFLIAHDVRPINNVVDITNYVMLFLGLPLHAFDASKLPEKQIIVRQAKENETLVTLDDKTRTLTPDHVVISTGEESIALAGVMGGANTEVDEDTTSIVLEAAIFDPTAVRKAATAFDLRSEASLRMEKKLDSTLPPIALALASQLLASCAEAEVATDILSFQQEVEPQPQISVNYEMLATRIGIAITPEEVDAMLDRLSFAHTTKDKENVLITPPTWRTDIHIFEDIVEEIARLYGFENLPNTLPVDAARSVLRTDEALFYDRVHANLQALGLQEILTYTLNATDKATLGQYKSDLTPVKILYPLNNDRQTLRTTSYYSMLEALQYHHNHMFASAAFYEITDVYGEADVYPVLAIGGYGAIEAQPLYGLETTIDFALLKTWFERLLPSVHLQDMTYRRTDNTLFHPGIAADVYLEDTYLGTFGKIHPQAAKDLDVDTELYLGEFRIDTMYKMEKAIRESKPVYEPVSKFPTITRDLALVSKRDVPVSDIVSLIWEHAGKYCRAVNVFDVYTGEHIDKDYKSVALNITFNSQTETLTNQAVSEIIDNLVKVLDQKQNVSLRK